MINPTKVSRLLSSRAWLVLIFLQDQKKPVRYNVIQKNLNIPKNTLGYFIRGLSQYYLITKKSDNIDDIFGYTLTEHAHKIISAVEIIQITQSQIKNKSPN